MLRHASGLLLLIVAAAFSPAARAAEPLTSFAAHLDGSIDIAPDGSVQDYALSPKITGDGPLKNALDRRIRSWRFEPVVDNGHPVIAHARIGITLQADAKAGSKGLVVSFAKVEFFSAPVPPPSADQTAAAVDKAVDKMMAALTPPKYPAAAMRSDVGARVEVVFQVDDDGRVVATDVGKMDLLLPRALSQKTLAGYAQDFRTATLAATRNWMFPPNYRTTCGKPCLLQVPVLYSMQGTFWSGLQSVPMPALPWATAQTPIVGLDPSGALPSTRKLIDPTQAEGQL